MCIHKNVRQWWNWIRNNSQKTKILSDKVKLERFRQKARCELPLLEVSWLTIPPKNTKGIHFRGKKRKRSLVVHCKGSKFIFNFVHKVNIVPQLADILCRSTLSDSSQHQHFLTEWSRIFQKQPNFFTSKTYLQGDYLKTYRYLWNARRNENKCVWELIWT